jgi:hypothetical protein
VEQRVALQMLDVPDGAGRQIVEHEYGVAKTDERLGKMGSDEPRAACNQNSHAIPRSCPATSAR